MGLGGCIFTVAQELRRVFTGGPIGQVALRSVHHLQPLPNFIMNMIISIILVTQSCAVYSGSCTCIRGSNIIISQSHVDVQIVQPKLLI